MIRNLKALGLALVAVFAMSALSASAASAAEEFHSEVEPTVITATSESNHIFEASGVKVECTHAEFAGTANKKTESTLTLHPKYTGCSGGGATAVTTQGCNYVFSSKLNATTKDAPVNIECEGTHTITVHSSLCTLKFGTQTPGGGVAYDNLGAGSTREVTVTTTVKEITITAKEGSFCFLISGKGTYSGPAKVKGFVDNGTASGTTTDGLVYKEGAQVGVWWE